MATDLREIYFSIYQTDPFFYDYLPGIVKTIREYLRNDYAYIMFYDPDWIYQDGVSFAYCLLLETRDKLETETDARKYFLKVHRHRLRDYLYKEYSGKVTRNKNESPVKGRPCEFCSLDREISVDEGSGDITLYNLLPDPDPNPEESLMQSEKEKMVAELVDEIETYMYQYCADGDYSNSRFTLDEFREILSRFIREPETEHKQIMYEVVGEAIKDHESNVWRRWYRFRDDVRKRFAGRWEEIRIA